VMSLAAVVVVQASAPTPSSGSFAFTDITYFNFDKEVGQNRFYTLKGKIVFNGTLSGTGRIVETGVELGGGAGPVVAHAVIEFTGTIGNSLIGTIDIQYNRIKEGGIFDSSLGSEGDRVFLSPTGAGGLAGLHGTAHFVSDGTGAGTYEGQYHFE